MPSIQCREHFSPRTQCRYISPRLFTVHETARGRMLVTSRVYDAWDIDSMILKAGTGNKSAVVVDLAQGRLY
jgi:hypothetical protein